MLKSTNRREHLKQLLLLAGVSMLPMACFESSKELSVAFNNIDINEEDLVILAELTEALLPETDIPGGRSLEVHLFILTMIDDCHHQDDREQFMLGLREVASISKNFYGNSFSKLPTEIKERLLNTLEKGEDVSAEAKRFYPLFKKRAVQGYILSEYVIKNVTKYELVPGRYNGRAKA